MTRFVPRRDMPERRPAIPALFVERVDLLPPRVRDAVRRACGGIAAEIRARRFRAPRKEPGMSWSYRKVGRASKLAEIVKEDIEEVGGCPAGSGEEAAKNLVGAALEALCKGTVGDKVLSINASGSALTGPDGVALSQQLNLEVTTLGDLVE